MYYQQKKKRRRKAMASTTWKGLLVAEVSRNACGVP
jgi:hypothetical protein